MKDKDNYDYLRGWVDGFGVNQECLDEDDFPEGFKSYDEVFDRVYELKEDKDYSKIGLKEDCGILLYPEECCPDGMTFKEVVGLFKKDKVVIFSIKNKEIVPVVLPKERSKYYEFKIKDSFTVHTLGSEEVVLYKDEWEQLKEWRKEKEGNK